MRITIAQASGFCMGVRMAMNTILKHAHESDEPIETLGPLIHNPQTMELLRKKNVTTVKTPAEVTASTVVIRTHGVPPDIRGQMEARPVRIVDATCPHVKRIHKIIGQYYAKGYAIVIFGDKGHAEVVGLLGCAKGKGYLIQTPDQIGKLPGLGKVCLVAQTTQNLSEYERIKERIRAQYADAAIFDTICRATDQRQAEVVALSKSSDAVVVVGGKNSANSTRLADLARASCTHVFHIETEAELNPADFTGTRSVAIASGASTPSWLLNRVYERLSEIADHQRPLYQRIFIESVKIAVSFNIYLAFGAALAAWTASYIQGMSANYLHMAIAWLYINSMYILNHLTNITENQYQEIFKTDYIYRHRKISILLCMLTGLLSIALAYQSGLSEFILLLVASFAGILYHMKLLPKNNLPFLRNRRLKDITLSKDIGIAMAWAVICAVLPNAGVSLFTSLPSSGEIVAFLFIFILVFIRTIFRDLYDIQRDNIVGRETLPIVLGKKLSLLFPYPLLVLCALVPIAGFFTSLIPANSLLLLVCPAYLLLVYHLFIKNKLAGWAVFSLVLDFTFYAPFLLILAATAGLVPGL
ncbi:MAG: 4-hydroxy-3-methylbut-2-enyl diphosphate reductase [Candidatus Raymondbacteria bacterium RifOxyA12_full_50_37]|uniref:4-hydroxy-3-methylbut-2-enyl diphosphate reductase n=1 Tax=Candidatus Raymondbacteria bacterium RIFOXYD12_FULL_49_13 TaxID=1817890 RepID=A0A1F7FL98_UNCRA|nr:MAG: 4-hydroxy-3-methylbut-2-enyl diphosphate reductase [Candidatus Raymondbacteria bacterium RifOxyA12_full_50_37]OGJ88210.1 MAG: 4-hydroxy-3-methylbut-2-enyl diphosphate reductase [Candidatus Raymondbacteria bacterium RIFOXYA2_FULL_49_16]OGJ94997.1 MAG: 4-hydroxy-3-methylbut-2-enyl diphosphate reductase [Candidatus Raymondbacteria bacterium RifOxyB12_full_50_8]OGK06227.1 MAG: 4-hydroxy-3-methylbut-2-enyl diphosphate reductase [Candidatus Raymondbacteria bacterium RifOxyC12_full_50_8]OGK072